MQGGPAVVTAAPPVRSKTESSESEDTGLAATWCRGVRRGLASDPHTASSSSSLPGGDSSSKGHAGRGLESWSPSSLKSFLARGKRSGATAADSVGGDGLGAGRRRRTVTLWGRSKLGFPLTSTKAGLCRSGEDGSGEIFSSSPSRAPSAVGSERSGAALGHLSQRYWTFRRCSRRSSNGDAISQQDSKMMSETPTMASLARAEVSTGVDREARTSLSNCRTLHFAET